MDKFTNQFELKILTGNSNPELAQEISKSIDSEEEDDYNL